MNQQITIEKLYEMYGKTSLERDLMREEIQRMQAERQQNEDKKENNGG